MAYIIKPRSVVYSFKLNFNISNVGHWSWPLTGMVLVRGEFKRGFVKAAVSRAVRSESFDCIPFQYSVLIFLARLENEAHMLMAQEL